MKTIFITFILFLITLSSFSQNIIDEKTKTLSDGRVVRLVTTLHGEGTNFMDGLIGYENLKILLTNPINKRDFKVRYYLEEYKSDTLFTKEIALHSSSKLSYINEITIGRMANNMLMILLQIPGFTQVYYLPSVEVHDPSVLIKNFKWRFFSDLPLSSKTPILLIYNESLEDDTFEKKFDSLFQSLSFKNLRGKDKIVHQIKSVTDNFYMIFYDVILNK